MNITIHAKDLTLTDSQKEYITTKVEKLLHLSSRIEDDSTEIKVEVHEQSRHSYQPPLEVQITFFVPGSIIRAEDIGESVEEAMDKVEEKLKRQIERYKSKLHRRGVAGKWLTYAEEKLHPDEEEFELPQILRRKRISKFVSMHEEEAIEQLESLGHDFYLFMNQDTDRPSVLYKRKDGFYGIIEPKKEEDFGY